MVGAGLIGHTAAALCCRQVCSSLRALMGFARRDGAEIFAGWRTSIGSVAGAELCTEPERASKSQDRASGCASAPLGSHIGFA